jgi:hypothetical protein
MEYPRFLYVLIVILLVTSFACNKGNGPVAPSDTAVPRACFTYDAPDGAVRGEYVVFDASCSTGGLFSITSYTWDWGDGSDPQVTTSPEAIHRFFGLGTADVSLTVTNTAGLISEEAMEVEVVPIGAPPEPCFTVDAPEGWQPESILAFDASCTSDPDGDDIEFTWDWGDGQTSGPTSDPIASHQFNIEGEVEVRLTVTDEAGWEAVSDPEELSFGYPTGCPLVATLDFDGEPVTDIVMQDRYVYASTAWPGVLHVIDISNPLNPVEVGSVESNDDYAYFAVSGDYGVMRVGPLLQVVDVSDPANPTIVSETMRDFTVHDAVMSKGYVFIAEETIGLRVLSLADPQNPQVVATVYSPAIEPDGYPYSYLQVDGNRLMVGRSRYFELYDISNPTAPVPIVQTKMEPGCYYKLRIYGDLLFAARCSGKLSVFDISNPLAMVEIGDTTVSNYNHMTPAGDKLILVEDGIEIVDFSDPASPEVVGSAAIPAFDAFSIVQGAYGSVVRDDYALVAAWTAGLAVYDISDPKGPRCIGSVDYPPIGGSVPWTIDVTGDRAYVSPIEGGLGILDISDPVNPEILGRLFMPLNLIKTEVIGDYLYYLDNSQGFVVVDITNPAIPRIAASVNLTEYAEVEDFVISGDIVYVCSRSYFATIDISDPENPELLLLQDSDFDSYDIAVHSGYAYLTGNYGYEEPNIMLVMDVTDPENPIEVTEVSSETFESHWPWVLETTGDYLCVLCARQGANSILDVFDISNPALPVQLSSLMTRGQQARMRVAGRYAYIADTFSGLTIVDLIDPHNLEVVGYAGARNWLDFIDVYSNYAFGLGEGSDDQLIFSIIQLWE